MQPPHLPPPPILTNQLTPEERIALHAAELNPLDFAACIGAAIPVAAQAVKDPYTGGHTVIVSLAVAIPESLLSLRFSGVLDPHTKQPTLDPRMSKAFTTNPPPMFRLVMSREVLAGSVQNDLRRLDAEAFPLPTFAPRATTEDV